MNITRALQRTFVPPSARGGQRAPVVGAQTVGRVQGIHGSMMSEWDAEAAIRQAYLTNWVVYRCATINAEKIASLPFRVGLDPKKPTEFREDAPLARLLGPAPLGPNPDTTASELIAHAVAGLQITGRFGWEIEWSGKPGSSKVVALWPLISQYLMPQPNGPDQTMSPHEPAPPTRYFAGFEYRSMPSVVRQLGWQQCFYCWKPSLHDWRQPESALQAARIDIAGMVEQSLFDYAFLKNGSVPANLVVTQAFDSAESYEAFKNQWGYKYGGAANAGKTAFVEMDAEDGNVGQMVDVKILGSSAKDSLADVRNRQRAIAICSAMGVPFSKLDSTDRTFNNAESEDETWEEDTILPLVNRLEQAINIRLAPFLGKEIGWFDLSSLKVNKAKTQFTQISPLDLYEAKLASPNEVRGIVGLSPVSEPEGDMIGFLQAEPEVEEPPTPAIETPASKDNQGDADIIELPVAKQQKQLSAPRQARSAIPNADVQDGVMVALMIDPGTARSVAHDGGEPPEQLHVTLGYMGKVTNAADRAVLEATVREFASTQSPLAGRIQGKGIFEQANGTYVAVGLIDAPGLDEMRHGLVRALEDKGLQVANDHSFTPHLTYLYTTDADEAEAVDAHAGTPLSWSKLTVAWGGEFTDMTLSARRQVAAGGLRDFSPSPQTDSLPEGDSTASTVAQSPAAGRDVAETGRVRDMSEDEARLEEKWRSAISELFARQRETTVKRLQGKRGRQALKRAGEDGTPAPDSTAVFDAKFWEAETAVLAAGLYGAVVTAAGAQLISDGVAFSGSAAYVARFIQKRADLLGVQITKTTSESVQKIMDDGVQNNATVDDIVKAVSAMFNSAETGRSGLIATQEVHSAYVGTMIEVGNHDDTIAGKRWRSQRDDRVRLTHMAADGDVVGVGEKFRVGGVELFYPGDPEGDPGETINCRCFPELLTVAEMARTAKAAHYRMVEEVESELLELFQKQSQTHI